MSDEREPGNKYELPPVLAASPRFQPPVSRRDFLGLAAAWSAVATFGFAVLGALRLPMPSVFPESNPRVKLGPPEDFPKGSATYLQQLTLWMHHDDGGYYAISSICTHLGCVVHRNPDGEFKCPCHGSVFDAKGKVQGGPAPKGLNWLALELSPDGHLVVDTRKSVPAGTRYRPEA